MKVRSLLLVVLLFWCSIAMAQNVFDEMVYTPEATTFKLFAPSNSKPVVRLYEQGEARGEKPLKTIRMKAVAPDLWEVRVKGNQIGRFYTFAIHSGAEETPGVFAKAVGINGDRGAIIDMKQTDPEGWVQDKVATDLKSAADSLSYATGMTMSNGLDAYLEKQFGITKELMPDFIRGLKEGISKRKDANFAAHGVGIAVSRQIESRLLPNMVSQFEESKSPIDTEILYNGIVAAMSKDTTMMSSATAAKLFEAKEMAIRQQKEAEAKAKAAENKAKNEAFMAENKAKEGVVTLPSGLQYRIIKKGTGAIPKATDDVQVIYEGKTIDGKVFDSTAKHGSEFDTFNVGGLIKGWTEALQLMPVGSKWEIFIPYNLAYGERGAGRDIAPYSTLIFTLELKDIDGVHVVKASQPTPSKETEAKKDNKTAKQSQPKSAKKASSKAGK